MKKLLFTISLVLPFSSSFASSYDCEQLEDLVRIVPEFSEQIISNSLPPIFQADAIEKAIKSDLPINQIRDAILHHINLRTDHHAITSDSVQRETWLGCINHIFRNENIMRPYAQNEPEKEEKTIYMSKSYKDLPDSIEVLIFKFFNDKKLFRLTSVGGVGSGYLRSGRISPKGDKVMSIDDDGTTLTAYDAVTGKLLFWNRVDRNEEFRDARFSPKKDEIATACADGKIRIYHATTGDNLWTLEGHTKIAYYIRYLKDGRLLSSSSNMMKVWDLTKEKGQECTRTLVVHTGNRIQICCSNVNPDIIASSALNGSSVKIWDLSKEEGEECIETMNTKWLSSKIRFSPTADLLAIANHHGPGVLTLDFKTDTSKLQQLPFKGIRSFHFSREGDKIVLVGKKIKGIYYVETGELYKNLEGSIGEPESARYSPCGREILITSSTGAYHYDAETGKEIQNIKLVHNKKLRNVYSPYRGRYASTGDFVITTEPGVLHCFGRYTPICLTKKEKPKNRLMINSSFYEQKRDWNYYSPRVIPHILYELLKKDPTPGMSFNLNTFSSVLDMGIILLENIYSKKEEKSKGYNMITRVFYNLFNKNSTSGMSSNLNTFSSGLDRESTILEKRICLSSAQRKQALKDMYSKQRVRTFKIDDEKEKGKKYEDVFPQNLPSDIEKIIVDYSLHVPSLQDLSIPVLTLNPDTGRVALY